MQVLFERFTEIGGDGTALAVVDASGEVLIVHQGDGTLVDPVVAAAAVHRALETSSNASADAAVVVHLEGASVFAERIDHTLFVVVTPVLTAPGLVHQRLRAAIVDLRAEIVGTAS